MRAMGAANQCRLTEKRKNTFLRHLEVYGIVGLAAKVASPHAEDGARTTFYEERARDAEFSSAWDQALDDAEDTVIKEMHRRGVKGYLKDVYGSLGQGQGTGVVGQETVFSDRILELYSRVTSARVQRALNSSKIEVSGSLATTNVDLGLKNLSPAQQELLRQILELEAADEKGQAK